MKWHVLGSYGGSSPTCRTTSFVINDELALDAGSITQALPIDGQRRIRRIVLSHSHLDHTASIPFFIENIFAEQREPVEILLTPETYLAIKNHLFNNATWPDFTRIPSDLLPALRLVEVSSGRPFDANGLRLTPIPVRHTVPTHGFFVDDGSSVVLFTSDTGPTEAIWRVANATPRLRAVIVEVSFPNRMQAVADVSCHLTPQTLCTELEKLKRPVPVYLYHLKPGYLDELREELAETRFSAAVQELEQGRIYTL
jgi:ribonuclease BN (tRNA processing enzyme)